MNTLIPTAIVDKNGRHTTVHKSTAATAASARVINYAPPTSRVEWAMEKDLALEILEDLGSTIVVKNHGAFPNKRPTVMLSEMGDGDIARGNCWAITAEFIEAAGRDYFPDAQYLDSIDINSTRNGMSHTAILVQMDKHSYVIDYTARQFSPNMDFPLILDKDDWKLAIEKAYGTAFEFTEEADDGEDEDEWEGYYD